MSEPRLTTAAHGSTRCVGCGKQFAMTPGVATVEREAEEQNRNRYGGMSGPYSATKVLRRWHASCLDEFEESNRRYAEQVAADREQLVRDMCAETGVDFDELMARRDARS